MTYQTKTIHQGVFNMGFSNTSERRGEIIACEKHGDFKVECIQIGERFIIKDYCTKCVDEKGQEEASAKKQALEKIEANKTYSLTIITEVTM